MDDRPSPQLVPVVDGAPTFVPLPLQRPVPALLPLHRPVQALPPLHKPVHVRPPSDDAVSAVSAPTFVERETVRQLKRGRAYDNADAEERGNVSAVVPTFPTSSGQTNARVAHGPSHSSHSSVDYNHDTRNAMATTTSVLSQMTIPSFVLPPLTSISAGPGPVPMSYMPHGQYYGHPLHRYAAPSAPSAALAREAPPYTMPLREYYMPTGSSSSSRYPPAPASAITAYTEINPSSSASQILPRHLIPSSYPINTSYGLSAYHRSAPVVPSTVNQSPSYGNTNMPQPAAHPQSVMGMSSKVSSSFAPWDDTEGYYIVELDSDLTPRCTACARVPTCRALIDRAYFFNLASTDKVLRHLGQGTFGKVVECWDRQTCTRVAVKIIRSLQKYRDASRLEIRVLHTLKEHDPTNAK